MYGGKIVFYNLSSGLDILDDPKLQATLHSATRARESPALGPCCATQGMDIAANL